MWTERGDRESREGPGLLSVGSCRTDPDFYVDSGVTVFIPTPVYGLLVVTGQFTKILGLLVKDV